MSAALIINIIGWSIAGYCFTSLWRARRRERRAKERATTAARATRSYRRLASLIRHARLPTDLSVEQWLDMQRAAISAMQEHDAATRDAEFTEG